MSLRWDRHFLQLALDHARMSKDPSTKVGAIIIGPDHGIRSMGFNGFPRGILDTEARLTDKSMKYQLMVHAELNAILAAAKIGISIMNCTMYVCSIGSEGQPWGGPPCTRCTVEIIQSGIREIVGETKSYTDSRWAEDIGNPGLSNLLLKEAGVIYRELSRN